MIKWNFEDVVVFFFRCAKDWSKKGRLHRCSDHMGGKVGQDWLSLNPFAQAELFSA